MTCKDITSQVDLDAALADNGVSCVHIKSERGVWLRLGATDKDVEAYGSATVQAYGSATVRAYGSATVRAYGSATVRAYGSATVQAYGSATVQAYGSATVQAYGSATVQAYDSATVQAYDSATVQAYDSASVHAYHRSKVSAGKHVAVHLHHSTATVQGGVVIDVSQLDLEDTATWADHHGVDIAEGRAVLYKAVDGELTAGQEYDMPTVYTVGAELVCSDWEDSHDCGGGFHLSPTTFQATSYRSDATRWLRCTAAVEDVRPIVGGTAKCKVRALRVEAEVDRFGRELVAAAGEESDQ